MEEKLNTVIESLAVLKDGQGRLEHKMTGLEQRMSGFEQNLDRVAENQVHLADNQTRFEGKLDHFVVEMRSGFKHVQTRLDDHENMFEIVSHQIKGSNG